MVVFHSLRKTLATQLAKSNVAPRVAMEVMRHSDLRLTMNVYTDSGQLPTSDVVDVLPVLEAPAVVGGRDGDKRGGKCLTE